MISICIPVYNYDVRELVNDLHFQADNIAIEYEILLIDDRSDDSYRKINRNVEKLSNVKYRELDNNIGRSAIRNMLSKEAKFRYLIFMDCDAKICRQDYLRKYSAFCTESVVCFGGVAYLPEKPEEKYYLRWLYGNQREDIALNIRKKHPNTSFTTFNFLIDKNIFTKISFDEKLKNYGHEDTLFALKLMENNISILHIDNPLIHMGLETADVFIRKTELSVKNLYLLQKNDTNSSGYLTSHIKLMKTENILSKFGLSGISGLIFKKFKTMLLKNLLGNSPSLFILDLYKLGYLSVLKKEPQF